MKRGAPAIWNSLNFNGGWGCWPSLFHSIINSIKAKTFALLIDYWNERRERPQQPINNHTNQLTHQTQSKDICFCWLVNWIGLWLSWWKRQIHFTIKQFSQFHSQISWMKWRIVDCSAHKYCWSTKSNNQWNSMALNWISCCLIGDCAMFT